MNIFATPIATAVFRRASFLMKPFDFIFLILLGSIVAYRTIVASPSPDAPVTVEPTVIPSSQPQSTPTLTACESATAEFESKDRENWGFVKELEKLTSEEKARIDRQALKSNIDSMITGLEMARSKMKYECSR